MKLNKQNKIIVGALAFLLTLTVGYAVFSQSLNITGTAKAEGNFSLIFEKDEENNPKCDGYSSECNIDNLSSISTDKKTLNITVDKLTYPTAYVQIPVKIKNEGSIDALLEKIEVNGLSNDDIEVTYSITDEEIKKGYVIKSGESKNMTVKVLWKEDSTNTNPETLNFTITLKYVQYTNSLVDSGSNVTNNCTEFTKKDTYSVGDVIAFCNTNTGKSEDFYVISDNGTTVTALAKYNLLVGKRRNENNEIVSITDSESDYGIQSEDTPLNYDILNENGVGVGGILFANKDENHKDSNDNYLGYWTDESGNLLSKYGTSYPVNVYDENSNLYEYVENYKNYFNNTLNKTSISARLITNSELLNLGCTIDLNDADHIGECNNVEFLKNENLFSWTQTSIDDITISIFGYNSFLSLAYLGGDNYYYSDFFIDGIAPIGLRPVIEIQKSEI